MKAQLESMQPDDIFEFTNRKLQVRDIFAMYNHDWDVIGELIQNAVDSVIKRRESAAAIKRRESAAESISDDMNYQPAIEIVYDVQRRVIQVRDNGLGIASDRVLAAIAPHYTSKVPQDTNRGEFGVGLAFVAFSSQLFILDTCSQGQHSTLEMGNGYAWSMDDDLQELDLRYMSEQSTQESYTQIRVQPARFPDFTQAKLVYILQRYTAIGDYWAAYNDVDGDINVTLQFVDQDGDSTNTQVSNRLWVPADFFDKLDRPVVDYLTVKAVHEAPRSTAIPNMIGQGMIRKERIAEGDREFSYYALLCNGEIYRDLAEAVGVMGETDDNVDDDTLDGTLVVIPQVDIYPGIFACKKGMPLGADIPRPPRSTTGTWAGFYIVVHSDSLRTEPGRKKLNISDERMVQSIAKRVFSEMEKLASYVISRTSLDTQREAIIRALQSNRIMLREKQRTNSLACPGVQALLEPVNEQTLIGIFHEMIGANLLKGYKLAKLSATETYDGLYDYTIAADEIGTRAFAEWLNTLFTASEKREYSRARILKEELMVVEFKRDLENIIKDFLDRSKYHTEIRLLVAWDANEEIIRRRGWHLQKLPASEVRYYGARYALYPDSEGQSKGILRTHVLLLKRFLDELAIPAAPSPSTSSQ